MSNFSDLFPGGGAVLAPSLATNFTSSRTWTAPQNGIVVVRAMGGGGGGARAGNATGGYSAAWGVKAVRVKKNDTVVVTIGAGGVGRTVTDGDGAAGGDTTVVIGGVTYIAYGGPGGKSGAVSAIPDGPSPSANYDFGARSVKPGWATGSVNTGGAGVDILAQGNNATTSDSITNSGGGGTGGPSETTNGGGAIGTASANGQPAASPAVFLDAGGGDWGISFYGGGGAITGGKGGNGGGGGGSGGTGGTGGSGGGGGSGGTGGTGGRGAGGGGGGGGDGGGNGGPGFTHLKFFADRGL